MTNRKDKNGIDLIKGSRVKAYGKDVGIIIKFLTEERIHCSGKGKTEDLDMDGSWYEDELEVVKPRKPYTKRKNNYG